MRAGIAAGISTMLCAVAAPATAQSISSLAQQAAAGREEVEPPRAAPVRPPAEAVPMARIPVAAVTLYPGDVISAGMLAQREVSDAVLDRGGIALQSSAVVGKSARRVIAAGQPVPLNALVDVTLVTKGVATRIQLKDGGLAISGYGMPLDSGAAGATIRLKNMDSGQIIVGEVAGDGTVWVRTR
ncbi:flagellar basal body P-ring formation chaperone FlgA [Xanthobacter aminoxidans]|uniref:flagellar basal body P-ring formation chaperone FlgA n=1 Tax=Xanthobacter aminoxidans TaxID=186280 RepID=UPI002022EBB3|nr:flagellar basal body P-ring formation chaperone FlgA [Xanthobacter aminoxidans]MCL8381166.1 flagellar basal body P-ring formation chaperone FlgA [Xanthobacter aminoxidans]